MLAETLLSWKAKPLRVFACTIYGWMLSLPEAGRFLFRLLIKDLW